MGHDSDRYADQAIKTLGMDRLITSPAIISKLGYGESSIRGTVETVYLALVRFVDERHYAAGKPAKLRTLAMTLRAEKVLDDPSNLEGQAIRDRRNCRTLCVEVSQREPSPRSEPLT